MRPTTELGYCLVTGGAGYLGRHLAFELIRRGHRVRVLDLQRVDYSHERLDRIEGDVTRFEDVRKACEGIDTVFHTAAVMDFYGWVDAARRERSYAVNVRGVENVVRAAAEAGAKRLVHTSSNNVTFGAPVIDGDETRPYAPNPKDLYTETKIEGEKVALTADGRDGLHVCAIRPGGIYGPGEKLMLPRVVEECVGGLYKARLGRGSSLSDNTYIANLVDAQIEAARHLLPGSPLCGQAYFITDGRPINYFEFFRPVVEDLGFRHPRAWVPVSLIYAVAAAWEFLHHALRFPPPFLTRLEVRKVAISHYNRIDKAHRDFGWTPVVSAEEAAEEYKEYGRQLLARHRERADA